MTVGKTEEQAEYSLQQRKTSGSIFRQRQEEMGFASVRALARESGLDEATATRTMRGLQETTTLATAATLMVYLDINIYDMLSKLGMLDKFKEHLKDPKYASKYPNHRWLVDNDATSETPLEDLIRVLPEHNKETARALIRNIITTLR